MSSNYKVTSRHPVDTEDGRVFGPGEVVEKLDVGEKHPHNQGLIDSGALVELESATKKTGAKAGSKAGEGDES